MEKHFTENENMTMLANKSLNSPRLKPFMKAVASFVAGVFLFQEIGFSQTARQAQELETTSKPPQKIEQFTVPKDVAITKDMSKTDSEYFIVNIKDVHDNYGAQKSIVDVLDNLMINYDVRLIGIEGSEGDIDMSFLRAFPDKDARKITADYLMKEGKISAGEFFGAVSDVPVKLYGIDDSELYLKNYRSFINLLEFKKANLGYVDTIKESLSALKEKVFSEDLRLINENSILNTTKDVSFTARWKAIRQIGEKYNVKLENYPSIFALMSAVELEKKINYELTNTERDNLLDTLTKKIPREELDDYNLN